MHSLYEKISQSVLGFMPFLCVCVILQEKNPPLQSALGIQYWKKLFPAERIRGMLSQRNFQALCYIITKSSSLIRIKWFYFQVSK